MKNRRWTNWDFKNIKPYLKIILLLLSSNAIGDGQLLGDEFEINEIAPDTYVATDKEYFESNTLVAKMSDGTVVVVSSPYENRGTRLLTNWIKEKLKPTKMLAINTHFHLDGTGGNEVFQAEGIETWASELTKELQEKEGKKVIQETLKYYKNSLLKNRVLSLNITPAKNIFKLNEGKKFQFEDETVEVFYPGPAHSSDNVVVYFSRRKILFGGCMIKPGSSLGYLRDANVDFWVDSTKKLKRFDVKIVVPGHGVWGGKELITKTIENAKDKK